MDRRSLRFGFVSLLVWAMFGFALEIVHGLKLALLDDPFAFSMLRLAHAHGVGLALVVLVARLARPQLGELEREATAISVGAALVPLGFALGAIGHSEGDPGIGIACLPVGALLVLFGLVGFARATFHRDRP